VSAKRGADQSVFLARGFPLGAVFPARRSGQGGLRGPLPPLVAASPPCDVIAECVFGSRFPARRCVSRSALWPRLGGLIVSGASAPSASFAHIKEHQTVPHSHTSIVGLRSVNMPCLFRFALGAFSRVFDCVLTETSGYITPTA
jgi:hypothetical protein